MTPLQHCSVKKMMMIKQSFLLLLFIVLFQMMIKAQTTDDFMVWNSLGLKASLAPSMSIDASMQTRFQNNGQQWNGMYFFITPKYEIFDNTTLIADIRYGSSSLWNRMRYGMGLQYKYSLKKLKCSVRGLYQYEYFDNSVPDIGQFPDRYNIRLRLSSEYKITKRISAFLAIEPLYRIEQSIGGLQRIRNTFGFEWEILKRHTITTSFLVQPQYQQASLQRIQYISHVGYTFELPALYDKKNTTPLGDE